MKEKPVHGKKMRKKSLKEALDRNQVDHHSTVVTLWNDVKDVQYSRIML